MNYIIFWATISLERQLKLDEFIKDNVKIISTKTYAGFTFEDIVDETEFLLMFDDIVTPMPSEAYELFKRATILLNEKEDT